MSRSPRTALQRAKLFLYHQGKCHLCGCKILKNEKWDIEHVNAYAISGDDSDGNIRPAHVSCHREKTKSDVAAIAKAKRREANFIGARPKSTWPSRKFNQPRIDRAKYINNERVDT